MVNGYCFGGAFTQLCACDFAIAADDATFGLSEVNWGIIPGGIVAWNVDAADELPRRDVLRGDRRYLQRQGAAEIGSSTSRCRKAKLRGETIKLAKKLMEQEPGGDALHQGSGARRALHERVEAADYLDGKSDALEYQDKEKGREQGMRQFLDEKSYRPGLGEYDRKRALKENQKTAAAKPKAAVAARAKAPAKARKPASGRKTRS